MGPSFNKTNGFACLFALVQESGSEHFLFVTNQSTVDSRIESIANHVPMLVGFEEGQVRQGTFWQMKEGSLLGGRPICSTATAKISE